MLSLGIPENEIQTLIDDGVTQHADGSLTLQWFECGYDIEDGHHYYDISVLKKHFETPVTLSDIDLTEMDLSEAQHFVVGRIFDGEQDAVDYLNNQTVGTELHHENTAKRIKLQAVAASDQPDNAPLQSLDIAIGEKLTVIDNGIVEDVLEEFRTIHWYTVEIVSPERYAVGAYWKVYHAPVTSMLKGDELKNISAADSTHHAGNRAVKGSKKVLDFLNQEINGTAYINKENAAHAKPHLVVK